MQLGLFVLCSYRAVRHSATQAIIECMCPVCLQANIYRTLLDIAAGTYYLHCLGIVHGVLTGSAAQIGAPETVSSQPAPLARSTSQWLAGSCVQVFQAHGSIASSP